MNKEQLCSQICTNFWQACFGVGLSLPTIRAPYLIPQVGELFYSGRTTLACLFVCLFVCLVRGLFVSLFLSFLWSARWGFIFWRNLPPTNPISVQSFFGASSHAVGVPAKAEAPAEMGRWGLGMEATKTPSGPPVGGHSTAPSEGSAD